MDSLGDVKNLSSTASVLLKTSIFAAWAQFQTASVRQPYLLEVIKPHIPILCPFWVASLREYAKVKTDPEAASSDSGAGGAAFDSVYSGLSRETALPFYERSWPQMLHAVASLLRTNNPNMLAAVDGMDKPDAEAVAGLREQPTEHFWVLYGLAFEALCAAPPPAGGLSPTQVQAIALEAVLGLTKADVAGPAMADAVLFEELCNLLYRLAITEAPGVKRLVMGVVVQLAGEFASQARRKEGGGMEGRRGDGSTLKDDRRIQECLRVATTVLREAVPGTSEGAKRKPLALARSGGSETA